ncbi:hypothetical protein [Devosia sp.]|uniref:hypothetical protein n=1 Tax=Devosia sp. TaxID=1871048 RepID=UPI0019F8D478|nr:hypothetical protein [Devosia sp.]MBE0578959.1 hypothetical protein [Devosia sp.]
MKMKIRHYVAVVVLIGVAVGVLVLHANVLSISLNGYSFAYHDIARHFLGMPPLYVRDRGTTPDNAFCGNPKLIEELRKPPEDMVCIADFLDVRARENCSPVATAQIVPPYVFPYSDTLVTNIAVTVDNASDVALFIESSSEQALLDMRANVQRAGGFLPRGNKKVLFNQCVGYGTISVIQSYFGQW